MQKCHKDNPQISKIMCYVRYCLQTVINKIDLYKLCTFTSQSFKRLEKASAFAAFLKVFGLFFIV